MIDVDPYYGGGQAFPVPGIRNQPRYPGLTLFDYFAAAALSGIARDVSSVGFPGAALRAYRYADAMMRERSNWVL